MDASMSFRMNEWCWENEGWDGLRKTRVVTFMFNISRHAIAQWYICQFTVHSLTASRIRLVIVYNLHADLQFIKIFRIKIRTVCIYWFCRPQSWIHPSTIYSEILAFWAKFAYSSGRSRLNRLCFANLHNPDIYFGRIVAFGRGNM